MGQKELEEGGQVRLPGVRSIKSWACLVQPGDYRSQCHVGYSKAAQTADPNSKKNVSACMFKLIHY